ncbi:PEP/pyruvate-binding domain-containing protein, partial [Luteolibacter marinus]|uniref:PEP/pyruvate-binding domain-containing protein n=1 Tax=Luteolibacter marinus TaxID=2776705 RepID=UPI001867CE5A
GFAAPPGRVIPFGVLETALQASPDLAADRARLMKDAEELPLEQLPATCARLRELIAALPLPAEIVPAIAEAFGPTCRLAVRSSANSEDLAEMAGAGLHESVTGVTAADLATAIPGVWASLWTERAAISRRQAGIPHSAAHMAVLIQPLVEPDLSFILHTVHPQRHDPRECYVELAVGLGETLASAATRGTPYRLACDKASGACTMLAFANFSHALETGQDGSPAQRRLDYSHVPFSTDAAMRTSTAARLARIAGALEESFGFPLDVEGVVCGDEITLVQARAQQGVPSQP